MSRETIYDEVFDAQRHFRLLLDGMARPGKIGLIPDLDIFPPAGMSKAAAMVAFSLLNTDVSFYAPEGETEAYLAMNTAARPVGVMEADFIFIGGTADASILSGAKTGTLSYPEESATFVISVSAIDPNDGDLQLILKGPGIQTESHVYLNGINPEIFRVVREQNLEFPLGIDLIIADESNKIVCVPRSNRFELEFAGVALTAGI